MPGLELPSTTRRTWRSRSLGAGPVAEHPRRRAANWLLVAVEASDRTIPGQFGTSIVGGHLGRSPPSGDLDGSESRPGGHQVPRHPYPWGVP